MVSAYYLDKWLEKKFRARRERVRAEARESRVAVEKHLDARIADIDRQRNELGSESAAKLAELNRQLDDRLTKIDAESIVKYPCVHRKGLAIAREMGLSERQAKIFALGYVRGYRKGLTKANKAWVEWNQRRLDAEASGVSFTEPPPDSTSSEQNGSP